MTQVETTSKTSRIIQKHQELFKNIKNYSKYQKTLGVVEIKNSGEFFYLNKLDLMENFRLFSYRVSIAVLLKWKPWDYFTLNPNLKVLSKILLFRNRSLSKVLQAMV
ncbi:MAG: hypothetical protein GWN01_11770 [Nitrosopumilaceae archaeon]|nr:hypothetical protein [Nitrosopumilaceae archaeon]NIU01553.1 hypothetical protein [Nitrosopumilaceae archaeon]NIU87972.1 hypothetical protein [Nitrosopumilaceae archaeon]NIV66244.1 hypothetical protein [Nitrosopumilaceae archaeon]NIX62155.1 hypothetical protein [Nitrosopumilaceae archaeon]